MKIVTVGGGTGASRIDEALAKEFSDIAAVVTSFDNGGSSGILRKEFGVLPFGDIRRRILAQSKIENSILKQIYNYRFGVDESSDENFLEKQTIGNLMILAAEKIWGEKLGIENMCKLFEISGKVLPITFDKAELCAELTDGTYLNGEEAISERKPRGHTSKRISRIFLDKKVSLNSDVSNEISAAKYIILCPGDFYTSLIPNFLVPGFCNSIKKTKAKIIFVSNIMTKASETPNFKLSDFVKECEKYLGKKVDIILFNKTKISRKLLLKYKQLEAAEPVKNDIADDERVVRVDLLKQNEVLRHDKDLFLKAFKKVVKLDN